MPTPELKSCGFLIVQGDPVSSFLLMKHRDRWDLPKGHVDGKETDMECALRELEEETGIAEAEISIDAQFRYSQRYYVQNKRTNGKRKLKELVIFLAELRTEREILVTEHLGFEWFKWGPPHSIQATTIDPLLKQVAEHLTSGSL